MNPDRKLLCLSTNLHEFDNIAGLPAQQVGHEGHNLTGHKPAEKVQIITNAGSAYIILFDFN